MKKLKFEKRIGFRYYNLFVFVGLFSISFFAHAQIHPVVHSCSEGLYTQINDNDRVVFSSVNNNASLLVTQPTGKTEVNFKKYSEKNGMLILTGGRSEGLEISDSYHVITPDLIERVVSVKASSDQRYFLDFGWKATQDGTAYGTKEHRGGGCSTIHINK